MKAFLWEVMLEDLARKKREPRRLVYMLETVLTTGIFKMSLETDKKCLA